MGGCEDQVVISLDMPCVTHRMLSPKDKRSRRIRKSLKHLGGKRIPAQVQVAACISLRNRECGVEEQYARIRPAGEIPGCGRLSDVVVKLAKDVPE